MKGQKIDIFNLSFYLGGIKLKGQKIDIFNLSFYQGEIK